MSSGSTYPKPKSPATRLLLPIAITVVFLLAGAALATWAWRKYNGPTAASKADCQLAQQLFDRARNAPSDPAAAEKFETDLRQIRYTQLKDDGISTQVGRYITWQVVHSTGKGIPPTEAQFTDMKDQALGHCDDSGVKLNIADIK